MSEHTLMDGKVHLYKRDNSGYWQCSTYLAGKNRRTSTREAALARAREFATDWYLELLGKSGRGEITKEKTFRQAAKAFEREYPIITEGERSERYVLLLKHKLRLHLVPFFGSRGLSEITAGLAQEYRIHRRETSSTGEPPARSTMHHEIVVLRQVLKNAIRHGWLSHLPDLSAPYKTTGRSSPRPWFSREEYKKLYTATRNRVRKAKGTRWQWACEQMHDLVLFAANTGLRPDEVKRLEHRDVTIVEDVATDETILEIEVRGKRGFGYCKSTSGAVRPYERLVARNEPAETDLVFATNQRELLNAILEEEDLKVNRDGKRRTLYSLRHSYICFRLMEGADIYQIAKNCRTSVEMIEKHYAAHIKTSLDTAAINVRRARQS